MLLRSSSRSLHTSVVLRLSERQPQPPLPPPQQQQQKQQLTETTSSSTPLKPQKTTLESIFSVITSRQTAPLNTASSAAQGTAFSSSGGSSSSTTSLAPGGVQQPQPGSATDPMAIMQRFSELDKIMNQIMKKSDVGWKSTFGNSASKNYYNPQLDIHASLAGQYKMYIPNEVGSRFKDKLGNLISFNTANQDDINRFTKSQIIKLLQHKESDTGSSEVQVGVLTVRINYLTEHMKKNKWDLHSRRGLEILVQQRRKTLKYLQRQSVERYIKCIKALNLRDLLQSSSTANAMYASFSGFETSKANKRARAKAKKAKKAKKSTSKSSN